MSTEILVLDEIVESQASKYVTHNTALRQIEGQMVRALSATTTAQPGAPTIGDVYILPTGATGTNWATHDGDIAHYYSGAWHFYDAKEGFRLWVNDQNVLYYYDGSTWRRWTPLDIDLSSPSVPANGYILVYDGSAAQWYPRANTLALLADVDLASPAAPVDGATLTYDATTGQWYAKAP